jgi:hypothetical protein
MSLGSSNNPVVKWAYVANPTNILTGAVTACWSVPVFDLPWTTNDDLALIGKLRQAIIGSDFNPAITLAEGRKSLQTIARAANAIAGTIYHARRGNFNAASKSLRGYERPHGGAGGGGNSGNIAKNHLEIKYGIKPILNDAYNSAITLAHLSSAPVEQVVTVTHRRNGSIVPDAVAKYSGYAFTAAKLKCILTEVDVIKMIGLTDPATVAWELVPYSFVADWFIPIGTFLEARGTANSVKGTFVSTKVVKTFANGLTAQAGSGMVMLENNSLYRRRTVSVVRYVSSTIPVPLPSVKPMKDWLSWDHALTAVALVTSRSKRAKNSDDDGNDE